MIAAGRILTHGSPASYNEYALVAQAWAQAFDTLWGIVPVGALEVQITEETSSSVWQERVPTATTTSTNPASWMQECMAAIAIIKRSLALYAANGYPNPPISGGGGVEDAIVVMFDYTDGVVPLAIVDPNKTLYRADVTILVPFDGITPTISVGTVGNPNLALSTSEIDARSTNQFENLNLIPFIAADMLILTINPSGSVQGKGRLLFELRP
jgi:hypothetical protein